MLDMDALAAKVKARRAEFVDNDGVYRPSKESMEWHNRRIAMRAAGASPAEMKAALEADRKALRELGHKI